MGLTPREIPYERPGIPVEPPKEPKPKKKYYPPEGEGVLSPVPKGFFKDYFPSNPELAAQDFYEVPTEQLENYEPQKAPWAKEVIRDMAGHIVGLPKLAKGESWLTFYGPDGKLYATKSTPAISRELGKYIDEAHP